MQAKKKKLLTDTQIDELAKLFAVLSDPSRLRLVRALMEKELTVSELVEVTSMQQGNVSKHLGVLLNARFVARERQGNFAHYRIIDKRLNDLCKLMCARIEEDAKQHLAAIR